MMMIIMAECCAWMNSMSSNWTGTKSMYLFMNLFFRKYVGTGLNRYWIFFLNLIFIKWVYERLLGNWLVASNIKFILKVKVSLCTCDSPTVLIQLMNLDPFFALLLIDVHNIVVRAYCNLCMEENTNRQFQTVLSPQFMMLNTSKYIFLWGDWMWWENYHWNNGYSAKEVEVVQCNDKWWHKNAGAAAVD